MSHEDRHLYRITTLQYLAVREKHETDDRLAREHPDAPAPCCVTTTQEQEAGMDDCGQYATEHLEEIK